LHISWSYLQFFMHKTAPDLEYIFKNFGSVTDGLDDINFYYGEQEF